MNFSSKIALIAMEILALRTLIIIRQMAAVYRNDRLEWKAGLLV